jgi:hypothetical protein
MATVTRFDDPDMGTTSNPYQITLPKAGSADHRFCGPRLFGPHRV